MTEQNNIFKNFKAVLFDFDGVIVDSLPAHILAWKDAYREVFEEEISDSNYSKIRGMSTNAIAKLLCEKRPSYSSKLIDSKNRNLRSKVERIIFIEGALEFF